MSLLADAALAGQFIRRWHLGNAQHVCRAGFAKRHAGNNYQGFIDFGERFGEGYFSGTIDHFLYPLNVRCLNGMYSPYQ